MTHICHWSNWGPRASDMYESYKNRNNYIKQLRTITK